MTATMQEGHVTVSMQKSDPASLVTMTSPEVALRAWHNLLIDIRFMGQG